MSTTKNLAPVRVDLPTDLSASIRRLADLPGMKPATLTIAAVRAGLPIICAQLSGATALIEPESASPDNDSHCQTAKTE